MVKLLQTKELPVRAVGAGGAIHGDSDASRSFNNAWYLTAVAWVVSQYGIIWRSTCRRIARSVVYLPSFLR